MFGDVGCVGKGKRDPAFERAKDITNLTKSVCWVFVIILVFYCIFVLSRFGFIMTPWAASWLQLSTCGVFFNLKLPWYYMLEFLSNIPIKLPKDNLIQITRNK